MTIIKQLNGKALTTVETAVSTKGGRLVQNNSANRFTLVVAWGSSK
jgi:hypothetical protein